MLPSPCLTASCPPHSGSPGLPGWLVGGPQSAGNAQATRGTQARQSTFNPEPHTCCKSYELYSGGQGRGLNSRANMPAAIGCVHQCCCVSWHHGTRALTMILPSRCTIAVAPGCWWYTSGWKSPINSRNRRALSLVTETAVVNFAPSASSACLMSLNKAASPCRGPAEEATVNQ